jgi:uncharacterized protein (DUF924 family)
LRGWEEKILNFWFGLKSDQWWTADSELDRQIWAQFSDLWLDEQGNTVEHFLDHAGGALAAVILFDQFPRNMYRGHFSELASDTLALAVARRAIFNCQFDEQLGPNERAFMYMPFQHSEDIADQRTSLMLFAALGEEHLLGFARKHHDVIERFGRFPHRNAMLGRTPRPEEIAAGKIVPW